MTGLIGDLKIYVQKIKSMKKSSTNESTYRQERQVLSDSGEITSSEFTFIPHTLNHFSLESTLKAAHILYDHFFIQKSSVLGEQVSKRLFFCLKLLLHGSDNFSLLIAEARTCFRLVEVLFSAGGLVMDDDAFYSFLSEVVRSKKFNSDSEIVNISKRLTLRRATRKLNVPERVQTSETTNSIEEWEAEDVAASLVKNGVSRKIMRCMPDLNGVLLGQLYNIRNESQEQFNQIIMSNASSSNNERFNLEDCAQLGQYLDKLFK